VTQTSRNFGASVGLAVLGTIAILQNESNIESTLEAEGLPPGRAERMADAISHAGEGSSSEFGARAGRGAQQVFEAVQHDFALSMRFVFYVMAGIMAVAFLLTLIAMPGGRVEAAQEPAPEAAPA
jgi:hypothetical protein